MILNPNGLIPAVCRSAACLPCHTVGDGQPTGYAYVSNSAASYSSILASVGCEDCHGPAGWHKASEKDKITPAVSLDPAICGSCHQGHNPQYNEYTNLSYTIYTNKLSISSIITNVGPPITYTTNYSTNVLAGADPATPIGLLVTGASHFKSAGSSSFGCSPCHAANNRMAMVKEYYDRLAGNPHPVTLFASADSQAFGGAACATCHDPHAANNVGQLRYPISSTNFYCVPTVTDPTPVLVTNSTGSVTTNTGMAYNTTFDSYYNPKVQVCGQCHSLRSVRWDGSAYGWITNMVVSNHVTQAGFAPATTYVTNVQVFTNISYGYIYTNGASLGVTNVTITTNNYVIPYATNQVWMASVTNSVTNKTLTVSAYYPLIAYTNGGTVYYTTNSSGDSKPHYPVQYNVLVGQLDYDLAARGGPANVLTDAHTLAPNQCADCHVPSYTSGGANVTGHKFICDYNSPGCLASLPCELHQQCGRVRGPYAQLQIVRIQQPEPRGIPVAAMEHQRGSGHPRDELRPAGLGISEHQLVFLNQINQHCRRGFQGVRFRPAIGLEQNRNPAIRHQ